jgi:sirohydrochlorin cobaltochelatase
MSIAIELRNLLRSGIRRIGELEIQTDVNGYAYVLCHHLDAELSTEPAFGGLDIHEGPDAARDLSTYAEDGTYRFAKGQTNLRRGWVMAVDNEEDLRQALDQFYPAALGLELARRKGTLEVENLRDKLNRQTGMYRFARTISEEGAQRLVQVVCGPAHQCARRILWKIDDQTPLADSEASRYNGIPGNLPEAAAIPLLCREACNHFVAECRKAAKAEFEAKSAAEG